MVGYLAGGMQQLDDAPQLIERTERITASSAGEQLAASPGPLMVDVRTPPEWSVAHSREGLPQVANMVGGLAAWDSARLPTVAADG